nr:Uncharacterized protein K02A2.6 [Cajanus cajan]
MPGIDPDFLCHMLAIDPNAKAVIKKRRKFGEEKRRAITEETKKLVMAGHVHEIQYPTWLANVVMVRKSNGKWRMCTDFTDLNKACPKDSYPLPNIDCLVDGVSGYKLLSFMDAYSGVMPFGLKNAGATYQQLMDKVLLNKLGRNVEAYVDDMVVKSTSINWHFDDLQELFDTIDKYQLKLNPEKCSFGVQARKFLGFLLTHRGIEANPDKCSVIINMRIIQETLAQPSINDSQGSVLFVKEEIDSWMGPYIAYLTRGELPEDKREPSLIERESAKFVVIFERLYPRGFSTPLLRFLTTSQAQRVMDEVHGGMCGSHIGGQSLVYKVTKAGYFWPTLRNDCVNWVRK